MVLACSVIVALWVAGYERDEAGEVILFIGAASVGGRDELLSYTELH